MRFLGDLLNLFFNSPPVEGGGVEFLFLVKAAMGERSVKVG